MSDKVVMSWEDWSDILRSLVDQHIEFDDE